MKSVIQVIGTTGVGKSQLGIELAKKLHGEIINSDSMQVYRGLDIITNKHPVAQREGVPHHLLGFLNHTDEYRIGAYEKDASQIIDKLHAEDKVPLVVGGTAYYATSLVFEDMFPQLEKSQPGTTTPTEEEGHAANSKASIPDKRLEKSTAELYSDLQEIDPVMATRWHPNDHRKIRRSLEIFYSSGKRQSEVYAEQRRQGRLGPEHVKYRTLFLWLYSDQAILDERLDARIDEMIASGLFDEIRDMHQLQEADEKAPDFTRGIFQAIGYKEFQAFLQTGSEADRAAGTALMKAATRRYARRQIKWIRNKLLLQCREAGQDVEIVLLDATDLQHWHKRVYEQGLAATEAFLAGQAVEATRYCADASKHVLLKPKLEKEFSANPDAWQRKICDVCPNTVTNSVAMWHEHLSSSGHKAKLNRARKRKEFEAWQQRQEKGGSEMVKQGSNQSTSSRTSKSSTLSSKSQVSLTDSIGEN